MICPKCYRKSEPVAQLSSVKMRFCKTSQISQKHLIRSRFLVKLWALKAATVLKRTPSLVFFLWICSCEYIFPFLLLFQKRQNQLPEMFCENKCSQTLRKVHRKTPVVEPFFKQNCRFLRTPVLKNICELLLLKRLIKKAFAKIWRQNSCDTRIVGDRGLF